MATETKQNAAAAWQMRARIEMTTPPTPQASGQARLQGLPPRAERLHARAERWIDRREFVFAEQALNEALAIAPEHPELLRLRAVVMHVRQRYPEAIALLRMAASLRPEDALIRNNLGSALGESGDMEGAIVAFREATEVAPDFAVSWFNLAKAYEAMSRADEAEAAFARATELEPEGLPARVRRANHLKTAGRIDEAAAEFRRALKIAPESAEAWSGLIGIDADAPDAYELSKIEQLYRRTDVSAAAHCLFGLAYALALEAKGRYAEAYETTMAVHALRYRQIHWDATNASRVVESIGEAFGPGVAGAEDAALGSEVIFLVGMPRSGSTLAEQVLAAHPEVSGAGELDDLPQLIREESTRRGRDFPHWVAEATSSDWARLGREYLERTAKWRRTHARSTDKNLQNWQLIGAIRAMLPGARIVDCRRDPVETCWSSLKHQFGNALPFTCGIEEIAGYWRDYDALMRKWNERYPGSILRHDYEALIADPETRVRALLDFCSLPFDAACLRFHEAERDVRTASAAQVRTPLQRDTARARHYGALLDPLRQALGVAP